MNELKVIEESIERIKKVIKELDSWDRKFPALFKGETVEERRIV